MFRSYKHYLREIKGFSHIYPIKKMKLKNIKKLIEKDSSPIQAPFFLSFKTSEKVDLVVYRYFFTINENKDTTRSKISYIALSYLDWKRSRKYINDLIERFVCAEEEK